MSKRNRRVTKSARPSAPLEIQQLETRQLLTGQVAIAISNAGDISIAGDNQDNDVTVTINAATISVVGNNGTSLKANGGVVAPGVAVELPKPAAIRNLNVNLKGGDDVVTVTANSSIVVSGNVNVNTGSGNDGVLVESNGGLVIVRGNVTVDTGSGNDAVGVVDNVKLAGANTVAAFQAIANDTQAAGNQAIRVAGDIRVRTGGGNDVVGMFGVESRRDINIDAGLGHGDVVGLSNVRTGRDLKIKWGDDHTARNVTVGRSLSVDSGTGDDRMVVENLSASLVDVKLGGGKDQLAIGAGVTISRGASIHGGSGRDNLVAAVPVAGARIRSIEGNVVDAAAILDDIIADLVATGIL